jgi:phospholipase/carboxylesterase
VKLISTTLVHKIAEPRRIADAAPPTIVFLHGRGADELDLLGLSEYFDERFLFISPRAPFPFQFGGGHTWYDLVEIGTPEPKMLEQSYAKLMQFLDDIVTGYGVNPSRLFLCGFSMGTVMSYAAVLTHPSRCAGVMANSGYIPEGTALTLQWQQIAGKPFFVAHGQHDPVIPVSFGHRAKQLLTEANAKVSYHEYQMAHQISEEQLGHMIHWISPLIEGR